MTLSVFSCEKIGPDGCSGPGILRYESMSLAALLSSAGLISCPFQS